MQSCRLELPSVEQFLRVGIDEAMNMTNVMSRGGVVCTGGSGALWS